MHRHAQLSFQFPHPNQDRAGVACTRSAAKVRAVGAQWTESNRLYPKSTQCNSRAPCLDALRYPRSAFKPSIFCSRLVEFALGSTARPTAKPPELMYKRTDHISHEHEWRLPIFSPEPKKHRHQRLITNTNRGQTWCAKEPNNTENCPPTRYMHTESFDILETTTHT